MFASKKMIVAAAAALAASFMSVSTASADLVAYWNFNNNDFSVSPGVFKTSGSAEVYDAASMTLSIASSGVHASSAKVDFSDLAGSMGLANNGWGTFGGAAGNALNGDITGGALAVIGSGQNSRSVVFSLSTMGYEDLILSFDTRGTSTGFSSQAWSYSVDGTNFTTVSTLTDRTSTSYSTQSVNFSSVAALDNQDEVFIKVTFSGASSTNGNNRIDNVQFNATEAQPVPEPAALAILSIGGAAALLRRRKA